MSCTDEEYLWVMRTTEGIYPQMCTYCFKNYIYFIKGWLFLIIMYWVVILILTCQWTIGYLPQSHVTPEFKITQRDFSTCKHHKFHYLVVVRYEDSHVTIMMKFGGALWYDYYIPLDYFWKPCATLNYIVTSLSVPLSLKTLTSPKHT